MKEFIAQNGGIVGVVVLACMGLNFVLSGLSKALELLAAKTESKADDEAVSAINKILVVLQKIVDWGSGNRPH